MKKILLINPWICDFAAYDLWVKPWGLLKISAILKKNGFDVHFVDVLDRHHYLVKKEVTDHADGTGKYIAEAIEKPPVLKNIPRKYKRYGLPLEDFRRALPDGKIDAVLVSSGMSYWYPGVFEAIRILKDMYRDVPLILGGTYATLAYEHALKKSGADHVVGNKELHRLSSVLGKDCDFSFRNILDENIDYGWYENTGYAVLRLSLGCPFECAYCAQKLLGPDFMLKDEKRAVEEIKLLYTKGIRNFAFYDDALLFAGDYMSRYLRALIEEGMIANFYSPNGLHARFITGEIAELMKKVNFINPVLSLETANDKKGEFWHKKVTRSEIEKAVLNLREAGYGKGEYMVYLMLGGSGNSIQDVRESISFIHSLGAKISLSEFSPIPGTKMAEAFSDIHKEPLLQNNSVFPAFSLSEWDEVQAVKNEARRLNAALG